MANSKQPELDNLIQLLSRLPSLGPKSAKRIALYLLKNKSNLMKPLSEAITHVHTNIIKLNVSDKTAEIPIGVSCRTCDRLDCPQRAYPPLHKKFDVDINNRGVSVYVND